MATIATKLATAVALIRVAAAALDFSACPQVNAQIARDLPNSDLTTLECANLNVPLDYTDDASEDLELNIFRVNASEEPVLGNVLINFGGPGGPGATNLPAFVDALRDIIGSQWNLLTWDPRGTGKTIPFKCTPPAGFSTTSNTKRELGSLVSANVTEGFLNVGWDYAGQVADACFKQANETGTLIGTAFVARDVMKIVEALDDGDLLNYYGWSYGTALGSYIAAMFPERVGRMVLDGNVNPHDYQSGTYVEATADIDSAFAGFLQTCFEAQDDCSLYTLVQPNTTADLLTTLNTALSPFAAVANTDLMSYLTWVGIKSLTIQPLYFPVLWPDLADTITMLLSTAMPPATPNATSAYDEAVNSLLGIRGSDATFQANSTREYLPVVEQAAQVSDSFSDVFYLSLWASARWKMPAKERYWGDFRATTNTPILYVNGEHDPVTPIIGAYNGSSGFEGSVVLAHSGYGHGLLASPSRCAGRYVQQYFRNASLPANGTTCEPDSTLLEIWEANVSASNATSNSSTGTKSSSPGDGQTTSNTGPSLTASGDAPAQTGNGAGMVSASFATTAVSAMMLFGVLIGSL